MSILSILTELANNIPNTNLVDEIIRTQPENIRNAIKTNNHEMLKPFISNKKFYANEVKVTVY